MLSGEEIKKLRELTDTVAASLASREEGYSVEVRESVKADRMYVMVSKTPTKEAYFIQIDVPR